MKCILFVAAFLFSSPIYSQLQYFLDKQWTFAAEGKDIWRTCTIPGNSFTALLEHSLIPDPYFADNESRLQWIGESHWNFKTYFELETDILQKQQITLECPGLDTYCRLYLNEVYIGHANNAFRHWTYDIKRLLKPGRNELKISIESAVCVSDTLYDQLKTKLPGEQRVVCRKPQYQFGWDFGPRFISSGITQGPYLKAWDALDLMEASVHTLAIKDSVAELKLNARLFIQDTQSHNYQIELLLGDEKFSFPIDTKYGLQTVQNTFNFKNPELWWPNGSGKAHLYPCTLRILKNNVIQHEKQWNVGIRTIELKQEKDAKGKSFYFQVNGKNIFCKGANYIPKDIIYNNAKNYEPILQTAVNCNFNMLRVWGGGIYEHDEFYKHCDEVGIMVWQDFMYACAMYPGDSAFLMNATIEAEQQVERLSKYACIALWCGNNESSEGWHRWGWNTDLPAEEEKRIWNDYQSLFENILPLVVDKYSNKNQYWVSSPLFGRGDERYTCEGDAHDWSLWHDGQAFEVLESKIPRFMSEFGFQSWPSLESIKQFIPEDEIYLNSSAMLNHQKHSRGNKIIEDYLETNFPSYHGFTAFNYLNQVLQADGIGNIIKAHRLAQPYCMGSLYWQFNDCWPGVSWSGLDYYGRWKALQYAVKDAFQPLSFVAKHSDETLSVYAISDIVHPVETSCEIIFQDFRGNPIFYDQWKGILPENSNSAVYTANIPFKKLNFDETYYILLKWKYEGKTYRSSIFLNTFKKIKLLNPEIIISDFHLNENGYTFKIQSSTFAKSVYLSSDLEIEFYPNFFNLHPGESQEIECKTSIRDLNKESIKIQSLKNFIK